MSSILSSQGLAIATAMVVSSTALFLAFSSKHHKISPILISKSTLLRSCLSSDDKKMEKRKKKKKVRFAEDVKEPKGNGEDYRKRHYQKMMAMAQTASNCRNQIPPNRLALYNAIIQQQRSQRIQCSF